MYPIVKVNYSALCSRLINGTCYKRGRSGSNGKSPIVQFFQNLSDVTILVMKSIMVKNLKHVLPH